MQELREMWVWSLGWEDPLEEEQMAPYSSVPAWEIPWTEEPDWLQAVQGIATEPPHVHAELLEMKSGKYWKV